MRAEIHQRPENRFCERTTETLLATAGSGRKNDGEETTSKLSAVDILKMARHKPKQNFQSASGNYKRRFSRAPACRQCREGASKAAAVAQKNHLNSPKTHRFLKAFISSNFFRLFIAMVCDFIRDTHSKPRRSIG
jgi:hypothetical protein